MIVFPYCKINLGLNIVGVRPNGYHDIESVFLPVGMHDVLEIAFPAGQTEEYVLTTSGNPVAVPPEKNLCVKALRALKKEVDVPPVLIHLHKVIPDGAGLGGGSSDAAFVIKTINSMLNLGLSDDKLRSIAASVGADCPFFISGRPTYVAGIGDVLGEVDCSALEGKVVVLAVPQGAVSTAEAYANMIPAKPEVPITSAVFADPAEWKSTVHNDFEPYVISQLADVAMYKDIMYQCGAVYAQMSGSGSSVFGIFHGDAENLPEEKDFPGARGFWCGRLNLE